MQMVLAPIHSLTAAIIMVALMPISVPVRLVIGLMLLGRVRRLLMLLILRPMIVLIVVLVVLRRPLLGHGRAGEHCQRRSHPDGFSKY